MTGVPDHYATLGVAPDADRETIRRAYVAIARTTHPDRASGDATARAAAARTIRLANSAWTVLGDEERRREYDRRRSGPTTVEASRRPPTPNRTRIVNGAPRVAASEPASSASWAAWTGVAVLVLTVIAVLVVSAYVTANDAKSTSATTSPTTTAVAPSVGTCVDVRPSDSGPVATVLPCSIATSGRVVAIVDTPRPCPSGTAVALGDDRTTLCLVPV